MVAEAKLLGGQPAGSDVRFGSLLVAAKTVARRLGLVVDRPPLQTDLGSGKLISDVACQLFDGWVARWLPKELHEFGSFALHSEDPSEPDVRSSERSGGPSSCESAIGGTEMTLGDFMVDHRGEILAVHNARLRERWPGYFDRDELVAGLAEFYDEMTSGIRDSLGADGDGAAKPPPSQTAGALGETAQRAGYPIHLVARGFAEILDATEEIAEAKGVHLSGREVRLLHDCVQAAVAESVERFLERASSEQKREASARLGYLAHEIRNGITSGRWAFELLRRDGSVFGQGGDVLARSLTRTEAILTQTLAAARLGAGVALDVRRIPIEPLLRDTCEALVPQRGITVALVSDPALLVDVDPRLFGSAVMNLLQNALKFTRDRSEVMLRAYGDASAVVVEVEDECGGLRVPPEQLIPPFVQGAPDARGAGLGLAIAREVMAAHGGSLEARSLDNKGCVFALRFPTRRTAG